MPCETRHPHRAAEISFEAGLMCFEKRSASRKSHHIRVYASLCCIASHARESQGKARTWQGEGRQVGLNEGLHSTLAGPCAHSRKLRLNLLLLHFCAPHLPIPTCPPLPPSRAPSHLPKLPSPLGRPLITTFDELLEGRLVPPSPLLRATPVVHYLAPLGCLTRITPTLPLPLYLKLELSRQAQRYQGLLSDLLPLHIVTCFLHWQKYRASSSTQELSLLTPPIPIVFISSFVFGVFPLVIPCVLRVLCISTGLHAARGRSSRSSFLFLGHQSPSYCSYADPFLLQDSQALVANHSRLYAALCLSSCILSKFSCVFGYVISSPRTTP